MYFCDSPTRRIYKQRYSGSSSLSSAKQLVYQMPAADAGVPDGGQLRVHPLELSILLCFITDVCCIAYAV
jgi:hypothetical protein